MFDWMKRRIQPLQARETFGFQYQGTTDSSRYSEEEISDEEVFSRVQRLLRDVKKVPIVPDTFSTANPPKQVLISVIDLVNIEYFYLSIILIEFAFCRRTWSILKVVLHCQAFIRPVHVLLCCQPSCSIFI